jgi:hypothetical protein
VLLRLLLLAAAAAAILALAPVTSPAHAAVAAPAQDDAAYPWSERVASAASYAEARRGRVAFAVVDEVGRLRGHRVRDQYLSASVVKAMLMVAYLNQPGVRGRSLTGGERALLEAMITRSKNRAATRIRDAVGNGGLAALARRVGMRGFATAPSWGSSRITAADQARFFFRVDRYVVVRHRDYARGLLASVVPAQHWGLPAVKPEGFEIFFKGGWRRLGVERLVHQVALLEQGSRRIALAVLTDGSATYGYGIRTIRGVAARLLSGFR